LNTSITKGYTQLFGSICTAGSVQTSKFVRRLKKDALNRHVLILDLYPEETRTSNLRKWFYEFRDEDETDTDFVADRESRKV